MKKKSKLFFFTDFNSLRATLNAHYNLIKKLEKNFDEVIFIDISNFIIFSNKKKKNISIIKKKFNKIKFLNFENTKKFNIFFQTQQNKIAINNFGKKFKDLYIHYLMKQNNIKQIKVLNIDIVSVVRKIEKKFFFKKIIYFLDNKVSSYFINILTLLKVLNKIEICFTSKYDIFKNFQNSSFLKKIFLFYNHVELINSSAFDEIKSKKHKISNKHILFIDYNINHEDNIRYGKKTENQIIHHHYKKVNLFLNNISNLYNKKVIVSIHPLYSINETKKFFKNLKVIQNKTLNLIKNAEIVILFNSTVINFAYLLGKKILFLKTNKIGNYPETEFDTYPARSGCPQIDIYSKNKLTKIGLEKLFKKNILKRNAFIKKSFIPDGKQIGSDKLINIIKKNFIRKNNENSK